MFEKYEIERMVETLESLWDWCSDFGYSAEEVTAEALQSELSYYLCYCEELELDCSDYMEQAQDLLYWAEEEGFERP